MLKGMGTAMITGANSGLGEEYCWQLAEAGHNLILVARREKLLNDLAAKISGATGVTTEVIVADLSKGADLERVAQRLDVTGLDPTDSRGAVGLLINNAGCSLGGPFTDNPIEREIDGLNLMVRAVMVLSHRAIASMRPRGYGAILNVSSVASETGAGTYSAHKAWVKAFTEGLSIELADTAITATCVMPGPTRTPFFVHSDVGFSKLPDWAWSTPEQVVAESLAAVRRGQVLVTPHPLYKALHSAMRVAPRWATRAAVRHVPHT